MGVPNIRNSIFVILRSVSPSSFQLNSSRNILEFLASNAIVQNNSDNTNDQIEDINHLKNPAKIISPLRSTVIKAPLNAVKFTESFMIKCPKYLDTIIIEM